MIPGLLAASGYERSDTDYAISQLQSGLGVWNNSTPNAQTLTIPGGVPSDSRYIIVGISGLEIAASPTTTEITDITLNGNSVENLNAAEVVYNTDSNYRIVTAMGTLRVPTGSTVSVGITLSDTTNAGTWWPTICVVDFGIIPAEFTYGSNTSPNGSGVLSISDMGNVSSAMVMCTWEDSANTYSSATVSMSSTDATREVVEKEEGNGTTWGIAMISADGTPSDNFPISVTPNTYTASDSAIIQYMSAHFS